MFQDFRIVRHPDPAEKFQTLTVGAIHKEQRHAVVTVQIAGADILAVSPEVRKPKGPFVDHPHKTRRAAAILHIVLPP